MEDVSSINAQLIELYGVDTTTGQPQFRIVWSDDQTEQRLMDYTDSGFKLLTPEVRIMKKYWYMRNMFVLERLVLVPEEQQKELCGLKTSYEPIWGFADDKRNPLPPRLDVAKVVIDTLYAALGKKSLAKYVEDVNPEKKIEEINKLQDELFGNETEVGDALAYKEGIVVPNNYKREN